MAEPGTAGWMTPRTLTFSAVAMPKPTTLTSLGQVSNCVFHAFNHVGKKIGDVRDN